MADLALVTGGAVRIGAQICRHLHSQGFDIALHYRHSQDAALALSDDLNSIRQGSCTCYQADLNSLQDIQALSAAVENSEHNGLALLVNNASGFAATPFAQCSEQRFDAMLNANLKAPYFLTQQLLPALRQAGGNVVNIVDIHATQPLAEFNAYCASKAGLASLTRSLAVELAPDIRVNAVAPGAILWPDDNNSYSEAERSRTLAQTPLGRLGEPQDIAAAVYFLARQAPFITGHTLTVDGGRSLTD